MKARIRYWIALPCQITTGKHHVNYNESIQGVFFIQPTKLPNFSKYMTSVATSDVLTSDLMF